MAVGIDQLAEIGYACLYLSAEVGISHTQTVTGHFNKLYAGMCVRSVLYGILAAGERLVLDELEATAVIHQRIASYASGGMVVLRETAVDYHQSSIGLDGTFALGNVYGYVSVDDVSVFALHTEAVKDVVAYLGVVAQTEISTFFFVYQRFVRTEVTFECNHTLLVKQW